MKATGKVTVKDIAQRMGVSLSTVNKALTGKSGISEKRRAEVIAAAREMGYEVNHVAQSLSRKPINIGIIIPGGWQQYFAPIEQGMRYELEQLYQSNVGGEFCHIENSSDIAEALSLFENDAYDIIIYCPSLINVDERTAAIAADCKTPIMLVGADCSSLKSVCTVSIDTELSGKMAADFLNIPLGGSGKVAVLMGSKLLDTHISKTIAFIERACELGLSVTDVHETGDDPDTMARCIKRTYEKCPDLGGIYVATGSVKPIVEFFADKPREARPYIVATDVYDDVRDGMKRGAVAATVFQNQVLMGRLAIDCAYRYLVEKSSYSVTERKLSKRLYVTPHLFLPSNLDCFTSDDGNDYRKEQ
ncbi:MAG: sugar ABC transporter substrate-binding protein [Clostridia bacterium]|nr:sugar ABC transporter substrate-binding protein [Clostridia bacterium]